MKKPAAPSAAPPRPPWGSLTNHAHVLVCLAAEPGLPMREVALRVGITERAVQRIIAGLEEAGVLFRGRERRRNTYQSEQSASLRHPLAAHCQVGDLLGMVTARKKNPAPARTKAAGRRGAAAARSSREAGR